MDTDLRHYFARACLEDVPVRSASITYIIDGNNFVVEESKVTPPLCAHLNDFLRRIDEWMRYEIRIRNRRIEVYVIFDSGAHQCRLNSLFAEIKIPDGQKADALILTLAHKIKRRNPTRIVRIISNDAKDEFAILKSEGFELIKN